MKCRGIPTILFPEETDYEEIRQEFQHLTELADRLSVTDLAKSNPQIKDTLSELRKDGQRREKVFQEALKSRTKGEKRKNVLSDAHRGMSKFLSRRRELEDVEKRVRTLY